MITEVSNIYAFYCPTTKRVKIGFSNEPHYRFRQFQDHSPTILEFVGYISIRGAQRIAEPVLHQILAADRLHGEWFNCSEEACTIMEIIRSADKDALAKLINDWQYSTDGLD